MQKSNNSQTSANRKEKERKKRSEKPYISPRATPHWPSPTPASFFPTCSRPLPHVRASRIRSTPCTPWTIVSSFPLSTAPPRRPPPARKPLSPWSRPCVAGELRLLHRHVPRHHSRRLRLRARGIEPGTLKRSARSSFPSASPPHAVVDSVHTPSFPSVAFEPSPSELPKPTCSW